MKKKKKWKEIRSAVTMMLVMVAMLSTATYAWFTLGSSATVSGLEMTATTSSGLLVSTNQSDWSNAIKLPPDGVADTTPKSPVTVLNDDKAVGNLVELTQDAVTFYAPNFKQPQYSADGFTVEGLKADVVTAETLKDFALKKTFYIKNGSLAETNVGLKMAVPGTVITTLDSSDIDVDVVNGIPTVSGSFVILKPEGTSTYADANSAEDDAVEAVRIALVVYENDQQSTPTKIVIWEPNYELSKQNTATYATNSVSAAAATPDVRSKFADGIVENTSTLESDTLFVIPENDADGIRVDVFIWFEGQDESCVNEIMKDTIIAQMEFVDTDN